MFLQGMAKENTFESMNTQVRISDDPDQILGGGGEEDLDQWDAEADKLYEWTQELSFDELVATPRVGTGT